MEEINNLLEKYNHFKEAQLRSIIATSDTSKLVTLVIQDDDGEDVSSVEIEFIGVSASRILDGSVLPFLDMMSGITLIKEHDLYGFALERGDTMLYVHNAPLFIVSSDIKIQEKE